MLLQAGRVRLLFIADEVPPELRRVVEFLNSQMDPAEVLAIEVKQFVGENLKTLVPRVLGQTETARRKKGASRAESRQWDQASFFESILERRREPETTIARKLLLWANDHGLRVWWGQGRKDGSFFPMYDNKFGQHFLFSVWTYGTVEIQFQHMKRPPFGEEAKRRELLRGLSAIRLPIPQDALNRRPGFGLSLLREPSSLAKFLEAFDWVLSEIKNFERGGSEGDTVEVERTIAGGVMPEWARERLGAANAWGKTGLSGALYGGSRRRPETSNRSFLNSLRRFRA